MTGDGLAAGQTGAHLPIMRRIHPTTPTLEEGPAMTKPRLVYFDFAGSRGEECRIALHLAGPVSSTEQLSGPIDQVLAGR